MARNKVQYHKGLGAPSAGAPRYLTMMLLRTCLTPLTLAATVPARFLASGVSTKPLN